jgi:hypothetical protein
MEVKNGKTRNRTFLAAIYSMGWGISCHRSLEVGTPRVGLPWPPSIAPPRAGQLVLTFLCLHSS